MTPEQYITNKCVEANPSIMALPPYPYNPDAAKAIVKLEQMAGKTLWNDSIEGIATMMIENYRRQQESDYVAFLRKEYRGRPITLADVLLAINKQHIRVDATLSQGTDGYCLAMDFGKLIFDMVLWNLLTDLPGQSEKTKTLLANILGWKAE